MFNFYVVFAGLDIVTGAGTATTCRCKVKAPSLKTKGTKMKNLSKTLVSRKKPFEDLRRKKEQQQFSRHLKKPQWDTKTIKPSIEYRLCKQ